MFIVALIILWDNNTKTTFQRFIYINFFVILCFTIFTGSIIQLMFAINAVCPTWVVSYSQSMQAIFYFSV